jgi:formylglycine-generating enzyme required for sulfatase activity
MTLPLAVALGGAAACRKTEPLAGLMVVVGGPSSSAKVTLRVTALDPPGDAGPWAYDEVAAVSSLAIVTNGRPNVSVMVEAAATVDGSTFDSRSIRVDGIPTDHVAELAIRLDGACAACASPGACSATVNASVLPAFAAQEDASVSLDFAPAWGEVGGTLVCAPTVRDGASPPAEAAPSDEDGPPPEAGDDGADASDGSDASGGPDASGGSDAGDGGDDGDDACSTSYVEGVSHLVDGCSSALPSSCTGAGAGAGFNCGPLTANFADCCSVHTVPGGMFDRDYDGAHYQDDTHSATVSAFSLDDYEVTVGRFRRFVAAYVNGWRPTPGTGKHTYLNNGRGLEDPNGLGYSYEPGWEQQWTSHLPTTTSDWDAHLQSCTHDGGVPTVTWAPMAGSNETLPINCVSFYDAYAFCIWDGGFLPSAAEWDFAAASGDQQRVYAWGSTAPTSKNQLAAFDCYFGYSGLIPLSTCGTAQIAPVGSLPAGVGAWGQFDLTGNMYEFVLDAESSLPDGSESYLMPCIDCANTTPSAGRYVRGGSFLASADQLEVSDALWVPETAQGIDVGLRCARAP